MQMLSNTNRERMEEMKRFVILVVLTLFCIGGIVGIRQLAQPKATPVEWFTVTEQTVKETVECAGKVESIDSEKVFFEYPCVAGRVFVKKGQTVKAGDPLFEVDADATQAVLSSMGSPLPDNMQSVTTHTVVAPVGGVISQVNVKEGEITDHQKPCAVISPGNGIQIAAAVREKYLQKVKVGQTVEIHGVGFEKPTYYGKILSLSDTAHQQYVGTVSETVVDAVIAFDDGQVDDSLRVGLGATAVVVVDTVKNGLLIPYSCIRQNEEGEEYVYVYDGNGMAIQTALKDTKEYATGVLVVSGISKGDRLVQNPDSLSKASELVCEVTDR